MPISPCISLLTLLVTMGGWGAGELNGSPLVNEINGGCNSKSIWWLGWIACCGTPPLGMFAMHAVLCSPLGAFVGCLLGLPGLIRWVAHLGLLVTK